jgi:hypothetical protein
MEFAQQNRLLIARDLRSRQIRAAADERLSARDASLSVRRAVGHSLVRFGRWLAAEPSLKPARSR